MIRVHDYLAARDRHERAHAEQVAADHERDRERMDLEAEAAGRGYDTTELEARHERERAAERAARQQAEAADKQAAASEVREAWEATREIAPDDADGPAMEARFNAFIDEVQRREIARWAEQREPEPPEIDDAEVEL